MKAYYWSPYPRQQGFFILPDDHIEWYRNQGRFYGFDKPDPTPFGLIEYETSDYPAIGHLCRFNVEKGCFEHRTGFDATRTEQDPFGTWVWGDA